MNIRMNLFLSLTRSTRTARPFCNAPLATAGAAIMGTSAAKMNSRTVEPTQ
jgi:hypothetical protein